MPPAKARAVAAKVVVDVPRGLTRDAIKAVDDVMVEPVPVSEWKGTVYVRTMSAAQLSAFDNLVMDGDRFAGEGMVAALLAVFAVCDAAGDPVFELDDVDWLIDKNGSALAKIMRRARPLNGMVGNVVEDAAKN